MEPAQRLMKRIEWLASPDPTWTAEDGRRPSRWAIAQAMQLLQETKQLPFTQTAQPTIVATARGGIEFIWKSGPSEELDVTLPADQTSPIEIYWRRLQPDGRHVEDERQVKAIEDVVTFVSPSRRIAPRRRASGSESAAT